jgi:hypothetical protein
MTGWNLPPGCNIRDIPGNRRIDVIWARKAAHFCANCEHGEFCTNSIDNCEYSREFEEILDDSLEFYDI